LQTKLNNLLAAAINDGSIPGLVATVATDKEVLYSNAFGARQLSGDAPMQTDSVMWIASMTKAITTAAAMQCVERGDVALDTPVVDYLPEIGESRVLEGFDAEGKPQTRAPKRPVTLHHLLTHTSGFSYEIWNADIGKYQQATGLPGALNAEKNSLKMPLVFDPGEAFEYGISLAWAGRAIEAVTGKRLGEYLQANLFDPLGMTDTAFQIRLDMRERLVSMHARGEDGGLSLFPFETPQAPEVQLGGEALYGTALDYQRFLRMLLNGGELDGNRVLRADSVAQMSKNQIGDLDFAPMRTAAPPLSHDTDFFPGMQQKWSYGFLINTEETPEGRPAGSLSWAGLSNCYYWLDPKNNVTGALYSQLLPFFDPKMVALFREFESAVYSEL